jgi:hypothetical protein
VAPVAISTTGHNEAALISTNFPQEFPGQSLNSCHAATDEWTAAPREISKSAELLNPLQNLRTMLMLN